MDVAHFLHAVLNFRIILVNGEAHTSMSSGDEELVLGVEMEMLNTGSSS